MDFRSIGVSGVLVLLVAGCGESSSQAESEEAVGETSDAITAPVIKLKNKNQTKFFNGEVAATDAPQADAPPECAAGGCDHVRVKVDLPNGTFNNPNKPGGVQIAIRWFGTTPGHTLPPGVTGCCGEFDTLNLFVYKNGVLRGQSAGILSTGQSVNIPEAEDGFYDVWIAYDPTYNVSPSVAYEGLAEVEFEPKIHPVKRTLPDLEFRTAEVITFDTPSLPFFEPDPPPGSSCFVSEMEEDGAQNCLRFDQIIANVGRGPVEIEHIVPNGDVIEDYEEYGVTQRVFNSDGSYEDQEAGTVEFQECTVTSTTRASPMPSFGSRTRRQRSSAAPQCAALTKSASAWPTFASMRGERRAMGLAPTTRPTASSPRSTTRRAITTSRASSRDGLTSTSGTCRISTSRSPASRAATTC